MKNKVIKHLLIACIFLVCISPQSTYTQEKGNQDEGLEDDDRPVEEIVDEKIEMLVEEYNAVVKDNGGWNKEYEIIKQIKEFIDNNFHNARGYEALITFYYKNGPLGQVRVYGQKAIDVSNSLKKIYFTRDIVYHLGLYYLRKSKIDYGKALGYFNLVNAMGNDDKSSKSELLYYMGLCYNNLDEVRENEDDRRFLYLSQCAYEFSVYLEENIENLYDLGKIYVKLKRYEKAIKTYDRALSINSSIEKLVTAKKEVEKLMNK